ncbi:MAG: FHA domain-containing protein, partial [Oscillospiraceae bacterium]
MNYKRLASLVGVVLLMAFTIITASADTDMRLVQGRMNGEYLDLFLPDELDEENLVVKVANQEAEVFDAGKLSEEEIAVRTTILIDNSTSMPVAARGKVGEFLDYIIKNINKNEEIRIVQFGSEIKTLLDFTNDRYDLDKAADEIKYNGQESKIYDAIYNTIPKIEALDDAPCFCRTILITDGVDYAAQGITKEELYLRLRSDTYPIDVVCVSKSKPANENKDLSALTRISNGRYFEIYPESDAFALVSDMSVSSFFWLRAEVPVSLLDGSTRQIDVSDGSNTLSFDMKMSVVSAPPVESSEPEEVESKVESVPTFVRPAPSSVSTPVDESTGTISVTTIIIIAAGFVVVAIAAIVIIAIIKKKRQQADNGRVITSPSAVSPSNAADKTEYLGEGEQYAIRISNVSNLSESWILNVISEVVIGRAVGCAIQLDEKSVSREQCKIILRNTGLVLSNVSSSNPTKLNGTTVTGEMLLHPADNIHFG